MPQTKFRLPLRQSTIRNTMGPLFLLLVCPPFAMLFWYTNTALEGSLSALLQRMAAQGPLETLYAIWQPLFFGSTTAWLLVLGFAFFQLALMRLLPGKRFEGPVTAKGNVPLYQANGILAFVTTLTVFCLSTFYFHWFSATLIYDNLGAILGALNFASLFICSLLYLKGRFAPSTTDAGITGNLLFDYYWGTELYPQVLGWPVKMFITCRFGMMSWGLILLSYAAKQYDLYGSLSNSLAISVFLQLLYVGKFFLWETGYLRSLDIMHDRAGFYICWGCLVWVPCVYTSPAMYLVLHPIQLSNVAAFLILSAGTACILINYLADRQRQLVRSTGGNCTIWGKKPLLTVATYTTEQGEAKENLLLASGWWGITRHFHYLPELGAAFLWSAPALFTHFAPYFYVCFLTLLLFDRAFRDDKRCLEKYGEHWLDYCRRVPYKIVPFLI